MTYRFESVDSRVRPIEGCRSGNCREELYCASVRGTQVMALEGTKVLDLTSAAPGPGSLCTMILADFGADVLKVQEPVSTAGRRSEQASGIGTSFLEEPNSLDRNKRSIVIDLKTEEG